MGINMKKLFTVLFLFVVILCVGCPPSEIRKADTYIKSAKTFAEDFKAEYPEIKGIIVGACEAKLIAEKDCVVFSKIDPVLSESVDTLITALTQYQEAINEYEALVKAGEDPAQVDKAWSRANAAVAVVISKLGDCTSLYMQILSIYKQVKEAGKK
jgi:hypothetical protein